MNGSSGLFVKKYNKSFKLWQDNRNIYNNDDNDNKSNNNNNEGNDNNNKNK